MFTAASLKEYTSKDLAQMAKKKGVSGWHSMRKDQLVKALLKIARQKEKQKNQVKVAAKPRTTTTRSAGRPKPLSDSAIAKKIRNEREREENLKNLAIANSMAKSTKPPEADRVILIVRDAFWLQAYWEITRATVQRAKVALNGYWHSAKPVFATA